ncbi:MULTISPECIES: hypothetical protein [Maritimibacter]|uniref:hypothetical protein n=1 Tax=Maritimibacter TaxID=404235 RepID=UPI0011092240|nr:MULTISPECIES: hypothetical protein [Maritimibacter]MBL6426586.1 hypothetical protein [Maritimibacter sp.]
MTKDKVFSAGAASTPAKEMRRTDASDDVLLALEDPAWKEDIEDAHQSFNIPATERRWTESYISRAILSDAGLSVAMIASIAGISLLLSSSFDLSFLDVALVVTSFAAMALVGCDRRDTH